LLDLPQRFVVITDFLFKNLSGQRLGTDAQTGINYKLFGFNSGIYAHDGMIKPPSVANLQSPNLWCNSSPHGLSPASKKGILKMKFLLKTGINYLDSFRQLPSRWEIEILIGQRIFESL
jgi:hypothetical protein